MKSETTAAPAAQRHQKTTERLTVRQADVESLERQIAEHRAAVEDRIRLDASGEAAYTAKAREADRRALSNLRDDRAEAESEIAVLEDSAEALAAQAAAEAQPELVERLAGMADAGVDCARVLQGKWGELVGALENYCRAETEHYMLMSGPYADAVREASPGQPVNTSAPRGATWKLSAGLRGFFAQVRFENLGSVRDGQPVKVTADLNVERFISQKEFE